MRICKKIPLLLTLEAHWKIKIKFKVFQMIMISLSFEVICHIVMGSYTYLMALLDSKFSRSNMIFWLQAILDSSSKVNILKLLVATILETRERICWIMWCLCSNQEYLSSSSWIPLAITNLYITIIFNFHGLHHGSFTFQVNFGGGGSLDEDDSFYSLYQNNNQWKKKQVIF